MCVCEHVYMCVCAWMWYNYTTIPHHTLLTLPTHTLFYIWHSLNIQQSRNTPCRGPGAYSVNVWGQRASTRAHNRQNNNPRNPYLQAKNLQRHLKKIHGENCTVHKFYCSVFAKPLHCRIPGTTACTFVIIKLVFHYLILHFAIIRYMCRKVHHLHVHRHVSHSILYSLT